MGRSCGRAAVALLVGLILVACGPTAPRTAGKPATTGADAPPTTTVVPAIPVPTRAAASMPPTVAAPSTSSTPRTTVAPPTEPALARAGAAGQVVVVTAARYGATTATLTAYGREQGEWRPVFGPWRAYVGTRGIAPLGEKREGDGRTPAGAFGFDFFFGVSPDPGVQFPYRRVTSRSIVWDEDPASPH